MQKAGLSGLVVQAGGALILERDKVLARATSAGITLWAAP
ncbi:MAG: UDP-2,3-diacylglucosamine diphosphatase LpxI domain-containing protein [Paracoccaceae bacterium]